MENENKKFKPKYIVVTIAFIIIIAYCTFWYFMCNKYRDIIVNKIQQDEHFTYDKIKITGFPFTYGVNIINPKLEQKNEIGTVSLKTNNMKFLKTIFSDFIVVKVKDITFANGKNTYNVQFDKKNSVKIKTNDLDNFDYIDLIIPELSIKSTQTTDLSINIKNIVYKIEKIKDKDYINNPIFFDIEKITFYNFKSKPIISNESNISLSMSLFTENDKKTDKTEEDNKESKMMSYEIDKLTYNSITHNYSVNINGNYSIKDDMFSMLFNIKLKNYDNLLSSFDNIANKNVFTFVMDLVKTEEDTDSDKKLTIEKKAEEDTIYINGKNISDIINIFSKIDNGIK